MVFNIFINLEVGKCKSVNFPFHEIIYKCDEYFFNSNSCRLEMEVEPVFVSMALYDSRERKKVTKSPQTFSNLHVLPLTLCMCGLSNYVCLAKYQHFSTDC